MHNVLLCLEVRLKYKGVTHNMCPTSPTNLGYNFAVHFNFCGSSPPPFVLFA